VSDDLKTILTGLASVATVVGVAEILWYGGRLPGFVLSLIGRVSWGTLERTLLKLVTEIHAARWRPDVVVAIGRTGGIVASILVENLMWRPPDVTLFVLNTIDPPREIKENTLLQSELRRVPAGSTARRVLVVDSETYTGQGMRTVMEGLRTLGPRDLDIKSLTFFKWEPGGIELAEGLTLDFVGKRMRRAVYMPWVITPELRQAAKTVMSQRWTNRNKRR
jgi:hypoxanthine phosphoribosyltransferase